MDRKGALAHTAIEPARRAPRATTVPVHPQELFQQRCRLRGFCISCRPSELLRSGVLPGNAAFPCAAIALRWPSLPQRSEGPEALAAEGRTSPRDRNKSAPAFRAPRPVALRFDNASAGYVPEFSLPVIEHEAAHLEDYSRDVPVMADCRMRAVERSELVRVANGHSRDDLGSNSLRLIRKKCGNLMGWFRVLTAPSRLHDAHSRVPVLAEKQVA